MPNHSRIAAAMAALVVTAPFAVAVAQNGAQSGAQNVTARAALSEPALSPDNKELLFVAGGDVWVVPAAGGAAHLLVAHPATESRPVWSPDGKRVAFVSTRTGNGDIYVLDLATNVLSRRTFDDGREVLDGWSRDGQWLYYSTNAGDIAGMMDVWRVSSTGGQPMAMVADRYASEYWSAAAPDGKTLAITARGTVSGQWWRHGHSHIDESEIWLVRNVDTKTPVYEPFGAAGNGKDAWPMWSPDGKTVYYMSDRGGEENLMAHPVGGTARALTRFTNGRVLWPQIAYDGSAIVFERNYGIWRYDMAGNAATEVRITLRGAPATMATETQTVSQGFASLALSGDTRKAAFTARGDIYVVGVRDGGDATRITNTVDVESDPSWMPDHRQVVYASLRGTAWNIFVRDAVTRVERALTTGTARSYGPNVSPDGKWIAYQRDGNEIRVVSSSGTNDHRVATADVREPPFGGAATVTWSPDSRWLAFAAQGPGGFGNISVVHVDSATPRQVSFGADAFVGGVQWSPDGKYLLYRSAQRTETPRIVRIDLVPHTPRFREDQFRDLFGPLPGVPSPGQPSTPPRDTVAARRADSVAPPAVATPAAGRAGGAAANTPRVVPPVTIVFDGIRLRSSVINTRGLDVGTMAISPDGKTLVFTGTAGGQQQIYATTLDELSRDTGLRAITTSSGNKNSLQFSPDSRELWYLDGGRIVATVVESRQSRTIATSAQTDASFDEEKRAMFNQARSYLANNFFDAKMNGVDWSGLASRVAPYVEGSRNPDDLRRVLSLMIGELNASHLGISGPSTGGVTEPVARLGIRFDAGALQRGVYTIREVIAQGPADVAGVQVGETLTMVDGVTLSPAVVLDSLLMGKTGRKIDIVVASATAGGAGRTTRSVALQPVSLGAEKALAYRQWVEERRAYVAKISNGRLGYVHMADMGQGALDQLYLDLDAENQARDGVVFDVRNNNGGFVNVYAIDVLSRRSYLQFTQRGASQTSLARGTLGQRTLERPTVLVTNQHTLSDGEDFTEGYRALGLGKVVGEPTSGWIIFTSNVPLLDGSTLRIPFSRVTDAKGQEMEMRPRPVDIPVVRPVGEAYTGKDSQLDAAVRTLLEGLPRRN
jgi:Tol biopolymer transport system component/C-terminal processing protease CtpA/Prc